MNFWRIMDYQLSMTAAALRYHEAKIVAELFIETRDWSTVEKRVLSDNLLQKSTSATAKREFGELKHRLSSLCEITLGSFATADLSELKYLAFLSCVKYYRLLNDFMIEVVRNKIQMFDYQIIESDWANFIESKKAHVPKIEHSSETTLKKIRQVIFKMLADAGIIDDIKNRFIQPPLLSREFQSIVCLENPSLLAAFLLSDTDIRKVCEECR
jgi:hypothetical protein